PKRCRATALQKRCQRTFRSSGRSRGGTMRAPWILPPLGVLIVAALAAGSGEAVDARGAALPPRVAARLGMRGFPHGSPIPRLAWSPDSKLLATGGRDDRVLLWETATGREVCRLEGDGMGAVEAVAFAAGGRLVASASEDGHCHLWDSSTGEPKGRYPLG